MKNLPLSIFFFILFLVSFILLSGISLVIAESSLLEILKRDVSLTQSCTYYRYDTKLLTSTEEILTLINKTEITNTTNVKGEIKDISMEYLVETNISIPIYKTTCNQELVNGSLSDVCTREVSGYTNKTRGVWEKFYTKDLEKVTQITSAQKLDKLSSQSLFKDYIDIKVCGRHTFTETLKGWRVQVDHIPKIGDTSFSSFDWWDVTWTRRKNITIFENANVSNLTDYQIYINVTFDSDMQGNFSDLRFIWLNDTDESQQIEVDYYIMNYSDSASAEVFVQIPNIPNASSTKLEMYFGNESVASTSNPNTTLELFYDWQSGIIGGNWTNDEGAFEIDNVNGYPVPSVNSSGDDVYLVNNHTLTNVRAIAHIKPISGANPDGRLCVRFQNQDDNWGYCALTHSQNLTTLERVTGTVINGTTNLTINDNWIQTQIWAVRDFITTQWNNGTDISNLTITDATIPTGGNITLRGGGSGGWRAFDNVIVTKMENPEPTIFFEPEIIITDPTTASPVAVVDGDNITITFDYIEDQVSLTSGISIDNVTIGGLYAQPIGGVSAIGTQIFFEGFESGWVTATSQSCDAGDTAQVGNFNNADNNGGDYQWCASSDTSPDMSVSGTYGLVLEDWDAGASTNTDGIWYNFDASTACDGACEWISVDMWAFEVGLDGAENCSITEQIDGGTPTTIIQIVQPTNSYAQFNANLSSGALSSSDVSVRIVCDMNLGNDDVYMDDINITGYGLPAETWFGDNQWHSNVSVPNGLDGLQDLIVNASSSPTSNPLGIQLASVSYGGITSSTRAIVQDIPLVHPSGDKGNFGRDSDNQLSFGALTKRLNLFMAFISQQLSIGNIVDSFQSLMRKITQALNLSTITSRLSNLTVKILDALSIGNITDRLGQSWRGLLDKLTFGDDTGSQKGLLSMQTVQITINNAVSKTFTGIRNLVDQLNLDTLASSLSNVFRNLIQNITSGLNLGVNKGLTLISSLQITMQDATVRLFEGFRGIPQQLNIDTITARLGNFGRGISQALNFDAITSRLWNTSRAVLDRLSIDNVADRLASFRASLTQQLNIGDITARFRSATRSVVDNLQFGFGLVATKIGAAGAEVRAVVLEIVTGLNLDRLTNVFRSLTTNIVLGFATLTETITAAVQTLREVVLEITTGLRTGRLSEAFRSVTTRISSGLNLDRLGESFRALTARISSGLNLDSLSGTLRNVVTNINAGLNLDRLSEAFRSIVERISSTLNVDRLWDSFRSLTTRLTSGTSVDGETGFFRKAITQITSGFGLDTLFQNIRNLVVRITSGFNVDNFFSFFRSINTNIVFGLNVIGEKLGEFTSFLRSVVQRIIANFRTDGSSVTPTSFFQPLDLQKIFVNTLSGSMGIFTTLAILVISLLAAFFRMHGPLYLIMVGLFVVIMAQFMNGIFLLVVLITGIISFYTIAKLLDG